MDLGADVTWRYGARLYILSCFATLARTLSKLGKVRAFFMPNMLELPT